MHKTIEIIYPKILFKQCFRTLWLTAVFVVSFGLKGWATIYYSGTTGTAYANATTTWWSNSNGTGSQPANFTTSNDIFILQSGQIRATNANWTIGAGVTLQIDGTLSISGNGDQVNINGIVIFTNTSANQVSMAGAGSGNAFLLNSGATLKTNNSNGIQGTSCSLPANASKITVTLNGGANYEFNGASQSTTGLPATVANLTFSGSGTKSLVANVSISGDLNISSGTQLDLSTFTANRSASGGTLTVAGTLLLGGTTGGQTGSNFPTNFSTLTLTGGTVNYDNLTGSQTIYATPAYNNLTIGNTSGTQTAGGSLTINGTLITMAGGTTNMLTNTLSATSVSNSGIIQTQNISSTPLPTGLTWGGTVNYNAATGGQKVVAGTYTTLTMGNTSGTQTAVGNLTVTTLNNNTNTVVILNMGTNTLSATTINNTGTIRTQNTTSTPLPSGLTWGGTVAYDASTGGQTIVAGTYTTLTLGNNSGTQTAGGNLTVTTLNNNTNAADILNMGTNTLSATTINNTGTIRTQNTSVTPISSGRTWGGSVIFDGSSVQTIPASTFNNLAINNTAGTTLSGAVSISGTLILTSGNLTTTSANLLTISNTSTSAISGGSATSFINGPVKWALPAGLVAGSTYNYPLGKASTYLPFSLINPTTGAGAVTAQVESFASSSGGSIDGTLSSKSTSEYWSLTTSGNFTNSSVSLTRSTAITPLDAIGGCNTQTGTYTSLAGTAGATGVTGSNAIGTNWFFVLAKKTSIPDAAQSTLTPTTASITANGSGTQVLTVQAKDAGGTNIGIGGATVTITKTSGTGTISTVTDNSNGTYTAIVTSPASTGSGVFVATLDGAAVKSGTGSQTQSTITYISGAADAAQSTLTPTTASITANGSSTQVLTVQAKDAGGTNIGIGGATVTITKTSGTGTISTVTDNSNGTYTATVTSPTSTGSGVFVATLDGATIKGGTGSQTLSTITYIPGAATQITINAGDGQSATAGSAVAIQPSVIVKDVNNNAVSGVSVTFAVTTGIGSGTGLSATTDASGIATVGSWTLGPTVGSNTLTATSTGLTGSPVTFTATGTVGVATQIAINSGNNQSATVGTTVVTAPSVIVKDANSNPVSGVSVTFAVATGGGSATGLSATTNASGVATVGSWTLGTIAGSNTLTATSTGLTGSPVTFTATGTAGITYYLTAAGAGAAQTSANWNTIADGSGSPAPNFTTAGSVFNIPFGINGVGSGNWIFGNSGTAAALTLTINGQLTINSGFTLTLSQKNNGTTSMTVNGTLTFSDASANQLTGTSSGSGTAANNTFVLASGATLQTANTNGIVNTTGSINPSTITAALNVAANYEFNGTAQTTTGLPTTINNLTLSGSGTKTLTALTNINGNFTISGTASTTAAAALPIGGDVTLGSGSSFTAGSYTHDVGGDWTNNGATFTSTGSTINFNGSGAKSISGSAATTFNNLYIDKSSGSVTLGADVNVIGILKATNGTLASVGHLTLVSTASQTALVDGSGAGSITGNVILQRYLPSAFGYKYFSSPFSDATVAQFSSHLSLTATIPTFYFYNEDHNNLGSYMTGWTSYTAGTLSPMVGYAANLGAGVASKTITLTGTVNNGPYSLALNNNNRTYTQGFNLIGNPYPSPVDWDAASGWTKTNIDNALYFFDSSGAIDEYSGSYSSYVNGVSSGGSNNIIPSMQGFFVHVSDVPLPYPVSGTLGISNGVRTLDLNPTFKSAYFDPRTILRFEACFDGKSSNDDALVLYFDPAATTQFDKDADALKLLNTDERVPNLYAFTTDNRQVSINGMPFPTDSITRVPLGITTYRDSWVSIEAKEIAQLPSAMNLYLIDKESSINQDLKRHPVYRFFLKKGEYNQRFALLFSTAKEPLPPFETDKLFVLTRAGGKILIYLNLGAGETGKLSMFNLQGQKMLEKDVTDQQIIDIGSSLPTGVYVINVRAGNRAHSEKTIIRKE